MRDAGVPSGFLDWARDAAKIEIHKVQPAVFEGLRGMAASGPIKAEEQLISVPRATAITLAPKQNCPFPDFVDVEYWKNSPWYVKMGLMLLHHVSLGAKSPLQPYIAQLPQVADSPVNWSDAKIQMLQYPYLIQEVKQQQALWDELYAGLVRTSRGRGAASVPKAQFYWALSMVRSRTFSGPYIGSTLNDRVRLAAVVAALGVANTALGLADVQTTLSAVIAVGVFNILYELILSRSLKQYAMSPVIDLCNHSCAVRAEVAYDYFRDAYSVVAGRDYAPGEQVFISYGESQSNDSLMQYYGFSEPGNAADAYVMVNLLKALEQELLQQQGSAGGGGGGGGGMGAGAVVEQKRLDELNKAGLMQAGLQQVAVRPGGFPAATLQALRYLLAPAAEAQQGPASFSAGASPETEARLAAVLVRACEQVKS